MNRLLIRTKTFSFVKHGQFAPFRNRNTNTPMRFVRNEHTNKNSMNSSINYFFQDMLKNPINQAYPIQQPHENATSKVEQLSDLDKMASYIQNRGLHNDYHSKAAELASQGRKKEALDLLISGLPHAKDDPSKLLFYQNIAAAYHQLGQFDESMKFVNKALELYPKDQDTLSKRAANFESLGKYQDYLDTLLELHTLDPKSAIYCNAIGDAYREHFHRLDHALEYYEKGFQLDPLGSLVYAHVLMQSKQYEKAITVFDSMENLNYSNKLTIYGLRSLCHFNLSNYQMAVADIDKYLLNSPKGDPKLFMTKGESLEHLYGKDAAISYYKELLETHPEHGFHFMMRIGSICSNKEEAIFWFNKAIEKEPKAAMAYENKGMALSQLKRHEEAIDALEKACLLDPANWNFCNSLAQVLIATGKVEKAFQVYLNFAELAPITLTTDEDVQRYQSISDSVDKLISLNPSLTASILKVYILIRTRKLEEAMNFIETLLQTDPKNKHHIIAARAMVYYHTNRFEEALKDLEFAAQHDPKYAKFLPVLLSPKTGKHTSVQETSNKTVQNNSQPPAYMQGLMTKAVFENRIGERLDLIDSMISEYPAYALSYICKSSHLMMQRKHNEALNVLLAGLANCTESFIFFEHLAVLYNEIEKPEDALYYANLVLTKHPTSQVSLLIKAKALDSLNKYQECLDTLLYLEKAHPYNLQVHEYLGKLYTSFPFNDPDKAIKHFERASQINPSKKSYASMLDTCRELKKIMEQHPVIKLQKSNPTSQTMSTMSNSSPPDSLSKLMAQLHAENRIGEKLDFIDKMIAQYPTDPAAYSYKGAYLYLAGRSQEAIDVLLNGIAKAPHLQLYEVISTIYDEMCKPEEALYYAEKGMLENPNSERCLLNYASALLKLHRNKESLDTLSYLLKVHPNSAVGYRLLGHQHFTAEFSDMDKAIQYFEISYQLKPEEKSLKFLNTYKELKERLSKHLQPISNKSQPSNFLIDKMDQFYFQRKVDKEGLDMANMMISNYPTYGFAYMYKGEIMYSQKRLEEGIDVLLCGLANSRQWFLCEKLSQYYIDLNKPKDALFFAEFGLSLNPDSVSCLVNKAHAFKKLKRDQECLDIISRLEKVYPEKESVMFSLGCMYRSVDFFEYDKAVKCFEKVYKIKPTQIYLKFLNEARELQRYASTQFNYIKNEEAKLCLMRALIFSESKQFEQAIEELNKYIVLEPNDENVIFLKGDIMTKLHGKNVATAYLEDVAAKNPEMTQTLHQIGKMYQAKEDFEEAIVWFDKAIEKNSNYAPAHFDKGASLFVTGKSEEAEKPLKRAYELAPNDFRTLEYLASCLMACKKFEEALPYYLKIIELKPDYISGYDCVGHIYIELDNYEKALPYLEKALKFEPHASSPYTISNYVVTLVTLNRADEALDYMVKAAARYPQISKDLYARRGLVLQQLGRYEEALSCYELCEQSPAIRELIEECKRAREN